VLTVHKAKGLEARVVFILNVIKDLYGFPCEIEDTSILEPARENYPHQNRKEEERRLFYVALSRAKEDLNIYSWEPSISEFLEEINNYTVKERLNY
jgi:DNA helicase-4